MSFAATRSVAQVERPIKSPDRPLPVKSDSLSSTPGDTLDVRQNTLAIQQDTVAFQNDSIPPRKSDIETTINYTARDSIRASIDGRIIWLYGNAKITYGNISLEAEEVIIDYANNVVMAHGKRDSLGARVGYPIFRDGTQEYETKDIIYNFKTRRARITEVVTQQGEGFLHGEAVVKNEKNELLSINNSYTTCNLEHPHFQIRATRTKAIPKDKIVSGPFYMEFNGIPLPLGFLFGMFPMERESKSGIIFPSYGEERRRGFNLRGGGYFFDINDYIKASVTGDIYSKGGHALYLNSNYKKLYAYNGSFNFSYSKTRLGDNIESQQVSNDFRLAWSHSPQSKGTGRFAASVNAATATYNLNNNLMYAPTRQQLSTSGLTNITRKLNSNISYSKRFAGTPFSMGINLRHNQDIETRLVDLGLPDLSVNMTNIYPFQRTGISGPFDNFSIGYSMTATNRITNNLGRLSPTATRDSIAPFTPENLSFFFRNARNGMRHSIPVSYSFKAFRYFTVSPSMSYEEKWYLKRLSWKHNADSTAFVADTTTGFNRIANYSVSASLTTRIYGMYFFKNPNSKVKAIRHIINPTVSFGYTPNFAENKNYFTELKDKRGNTIYRSRHDGFVYGGSSLGRSGAVGFSLSNNLEMKVKGARDTVERKVMLLNNLSLNTSYNLIADSFNLAPVSIAANTNILNNTVNLNLSATLDPYYYASTTNPENGVTTERRTSTYAWRAGRLGRITTATLALNTNLNPQKREQDNKSREKIAKSDLPEQEKEFMLEHPQVYIDFEIPWSLNLGYNLSYSHQLNRKATIVQTIQASGDISLSEKWKITFNTGYHFEMREFTTTNLGISRDLHCWTMNFTWSPFGRFESFNFTIAVKASVLQDLKLERRKNFTDYL